MSWASASFPVNSIQYHCAFSREDWTAYYIFKICYKTIIERGVKVCGFVFHWDLVYSLIHSQLWTLSLELGVNSVSDHSQCTHPCPQIQTYILGYLLLAFHSRIIPGGGVRDHIGLQGSNLHKAACKANDLPA